MNVESQRASKRLSASERRDSIALTLAQSSYVSIGDMAKRLRVSEMTVRRDLDVLVARGVAERAHGGAIARRTNQDIHLDIFEPALHLRMRENSEAKARIGRAAASLITPKQTVAVDIGSTTLSLAHAIQDMDVRVFTNSVKIGLMLSTAAPRVYMPGGEIRGTEPSLVGDLARRQLESFHFDWAFLGASGIASDGLYDYSLDDTEIKRAFADRAERVVALLDSSKFNHLSVVKICNLGAIDLLITDQTPDDVLVERLAASGVELQVAD